MKKGIFGSRFEAIFFLGISFLVLILAALPFLLTILQGPEDYRYFTLEGHDEFVYLSWMKQAANGHLLFDNSYAIEEHRRSFFHPLFLVLGKLAPLLNISLPGMLIVARVICGFFLLFSAYWAISFFFRELFWRFLTFALFGLSGGISFGTKLTDSFDLAWDLRYPLLFCEMTTFSQMVTFPHLTSSIASLIVSFIFLGKFLAKGEKKFIFLAVIFSNLSLMIHPYQTLVIFLFPLIILTLLFLKNDLSGSRLTGTFLFLVLNLPTALFYWLAAVTNPVFSDWMKSEIPPFPPRSLAIGYGFLWPLFFLGVAMIVVDKRKKILELVPFVGSLFLILVYYSPLLFARKLLEDFHFPLILGGVLGLKKLVARVRFLPQLGLRAQKIKTGAVAMAAILVVVFFSLSVPETIQLYVGGCTGFQRKCYLTDNESEASKWLEVHGKEEDVVLPTSSVAGYSLPAVTGKKVFLGHYYQTPNFSPKRLQLLRFHQSQTSDGWRLQFLKKNKVDWYFMRKNDGEVKVFNFSAKGKSFLRPVFENGEVKIFQVKTD